MLIVASSSTTNRLERRVFVFFVSQYIQLSFILLSSVHRCHFSHLTPDEEVDQNLTPGEDGDRAGGCQNGVPGVGSPAVLHIPPKCSCRSREAEEAEGSTVRDTTILSREKKAKTPFRVPGDGEVHYRGYIVLYGT